MRGVNLGEVYEAIGRRIDGAMLTLGWRLNSPAEARIGDLEYGGIGRTMVKTGSV